MNYQTAARAAIREWDAYRKSSLIKEIEKTAEFRKLTVYESTGTGKKLQHVLFGLEFCNKDGSNYREIMISVHRTPQRPRTPFVVVRLYTITVLK